MRDLIDRQAAIDAVNEWLKLYVINRTMSNITSIQDILRQLPSAQPVQWIPCSERLPEEDHWLGGSGRQFSDEVMVSVANYDDDIWIDISQTIDGQWALELPSHCEIIAWIPLPEPYKGEQE